MVEYTYWWWWKESWTGYVRGSSIFSEFSWSLPVWMGKQSWRFLQLFCSDIWA